MSRDRQDPTRRHVLQQLGAAGVLLPGGLALLPSCGEPGGEADVVRFAVITDLHVKADPERINNQVLAETVDILNAMDPPPELVLLTGDLVDQLPSDDPAYYEENTTAVHQVATLLAGLAMPALPSLGNHDYFTNDGVLENEVTEDPEAREALMMEHLGMPGPWYRYDHRGVAFCALNTMQPDPDADWHPGECGSFGPEQLAWLEQQLAGGLPCVLFFHHPLALDNAVEAGLAAIRPFEVPRAGVDKYVGTEYEGWTDPIYALLEQYADRIPAVFVGHGHWFVRDELAGTPVMMTDSVGNSVLLSELDGAPMRYHLVDLDVATGAVTIVNREQFEYDGT